MFERLGEFVSRAWIALLAVWIALFLALWAAAPNWLDVVDEGEFSFLPTTTPSRQAEALFTKTFSSDLQGSSLVLIAQRDAREGLRDEDKTYIEEVLVPRLKRLVELAARGEAKDDSAGRGGQIAARVKRCQRKQKRIGEPRLEGGHEGRHRRGHPRRRSRRVVPPDRLPLSHIFGC